MRLGLTLQRWLSDGLGRSMPLEVVIHSSPRNGGAAHQAGPCGEAPGLLGRRGQGEEEARGLGKAGRAGETGWDWLGGTVRVGSGL